ncbi:MAG: putative ABC transporter permease, partial [[Ruminococcus] torques]
IFSFTVELFSGYKLWDFSEFFLNINGRIYLGGSAAFALLGCAFIYYLAPNWTNYFSKLSKKTQTVFCVILNSLFITDVILTLIFSY